MPTIPSKDVIIIGAGIAGLSAGIYAQMNGYRARIYEMHNLPGGLMTAWKRKGYTIDGCIHWLTYSSPHYNGYAMWEEIGLVQGREMFDPEIFARHEGPAGQVLNVYADVNRLEAHLLEIAPEDSGIIREMCGAIRTFTHFNPPASINSFGGFFKALAGLPGMLTALPLFRKWSSTTMQDLSNRFTNPFLRQTFCEIWYPNMSAIGLIFTLAMLHNHGAGYPMGGSLPMALAVEKRFRELGGEIFYDSRVEKILVEDARAVGVRLADGSQPRADVVISAADGHATLFDMLDGRYIDDKTRAMYQRGEIFPPLLFIGLGVKREFPEFHGLTGGLSMRLEQPVEIGGQITDRLDVMIYNFDPSLAPAGKTVLTVMLNSNYDYWKELHGEPERYEAEKERAALTVISQIDRRFPGVSGLVEMADVATPLTFERYTGNWQGSFEGWLPTPAALLKPIAKSMPGLENFYMVGQWVQAGGGLPSGVMTGREVVQRMCKKDGRRFHASRE
jgi:phytoene dehydrogenase-like protein